ncbi:MAG: YbhB/YbcL family Raf kinase inhibitor-like protein [Corynebacterium sp.]|nr:YbhB/YbcL family Raf kinase inhibitor-like protein [Corynebacterium sp.]
MSTYDSARFPAADPYAALRQLPPFTLASADFPDGEKIPEKFIATGENLSPELHWEGFPESTTHFALTCFDPDAPTTSGFWHWGVVNIPASVTSIPTGAGSTGDLGLGEGVFTMRNDAATHDYYGPNPPAGWPHRYIFALWSLDAPLDIDPNVPMAQLGFNLNFKATGRAITWGWYEN